MNENIYQPSLQKANTENKIDENITKTEIIDNNININNKNLNLKSNICNNSKNYVNCQVNQYEKWENTNNNDNIKDASKNYVDSQSRFNKLVVNDP